MRFLGALFLALALTVDPCSAQGEKRVALVIGNSAYQHTSPLNNTVNDAADLTGSLKRLGFEVLEGRDLDKRSMERVIRQFGVQLSGADLALFFYAGHGVQLGGQNFLVPTDARLAHEGDVDFEVLPLALVLRQMEREARTSLLLLDACRDNPLAKNLARSMGTRSSHIGQGLAEVKTGVGTLIGFSTQPGNVALDGTGRNSPYTGALLKHIEAPGKDVSAVLVAVRNDVLKATAGKQVPWEHTSLTGVVQLRALPASPPAQDKVAPAPAPLFPPQLSEASQVWPLVKDTTDIRALEAFRRQYGSTNSFFDRLAEARIEELKRTQVAAAGPPPTPKPELMPQAKPAVQITPAPPPPPPAGCSGVEAQVGSERRCLRPRDIFKDCPSCPEMVVIPAGVFRMGSNDGDSDETPVHDVTIVRPFAVGKFEVTFAEWDACIADGGCNHRPDDMDWGRERRPVVDVSWNDIVHSYLPWLNRATGKQYRLLTEAEWEYGAKAGTTSRYAWGNDLGRALANCDICGSQWDNRQSATVGSFRANAFGLYDMHGNVAEWVQDCYQDSYANARSDGLPAPERERGAVAEQRSRTIGDPDDTDQAGRRPQGDVAGCHRVLRGGSLESGPHFLRSAHRNWSAADIRKRSSGFRVARTL